MKRSFTWFWIAGSLFLMGLSASSVSAQTASFVSSGTCPAISYTLYADRTDADTGGQVTRLQQYLKNTVVRNSSGTAVSVYPDGLITGFFGPLTEQAVERFQCALGIVCSGEPNTTGYGQVGPRTQALMNANCGGSTGTVSTGSGSTVATGNGSGSSTSSGSSATTPNPSSAPELELISINPGTTHTGSGGFPSMTVVVRNNGGNTGNASFTVRGTPPTGGAVMPVFQTTSTAVGSGQSKTITVPNTTPGLSIPAGTYSYTVTVDSNNTTQDSNRANNTATINITVGASASTVNIGTPSTGTGSGSTGGTGTGVNTSTLPDLILSNITGNPNSRLPEVAWVSANINASITFTLRPENTTLGLPSLTSWDYSTQSSQISLSQGSGYGGSFKLRSSDTLQDTQVNLPAGTYRYIATIDSSNAVTESNETNNVSYWYYNTTAGLIYPEGQRGDPGPGGCTAPDGTTAHNNETIKIYSIRNRPSSSRCALSGATTTTYFLDYTTNWCRDGNLQQIQSFPGVAAGSFTKCPLLKPAPFVKITPVSPTGTKVNSEGTSSAYNLACIFKNQDMVYDVELVGNDLGIQEPTNWRVVPFADVVRSENLPNPLNLAWAGMTTAGYRTALSYSTNSSGQTTDSGTAVITKDKAVSTVSSNQVSIQQLSSNKVRVTAKISAYYPGITFPQPVQVAVDIKTDTVAGKTTLYSLLYYNPGNPYYYLHPRDLAGNSNTDTLFFSGFDDEGAASGACQDPKNIAQRTQVVTSSGTGTTGNQTSTTHTPPTGITWYLEKTGNKLSNGSEEYDTALCKIYKSPTYGNWFVPGGSALATSNFVPNIEEVWNLCSSTGTTPTWHNKISITSLPTALALDKNLGYSDVGKAALVLYSDALSGAPFKGGYELPALQSTALSFPAGTDQGALRQISRAIEKIAEVGGSSNSETIKNLFATQGYGEFLPGGRWFTAPYSEYNTPLSDPFQQSNLWIPDWAPGSQGTWGTAMTSPDGVANWLTTALGNGIYVAGSSTLVPPRYTPIYSQFGQWNVAPNANWNMDTGEDNMRTVIDRVFREAATSARTGLAKGYLFAGYAEFIPTNYLRDALTDLITNTPENQRANVASVFAKEGFAQYITGATNPTPTLEVKAGSILLHGKITNVLLKTTGAPAGSRIHLFLVNSQGQEVARLTKYGLPSWVGSYDLRPDGAWGTNAGQIVIQNHSEIKFKDMLANLPDGTYQIKAVLYSGRKVFSNAPSGYTEPSILLQTTGSGKLYYSKQQFELTTQPTAPRTGDRIELIDGYPGVIRSDASLSSSILGTQPAGAEGTVIGGPLVTNNLTWYQVNFDSGIDGWVGNETTLFAYSKIPTILSSGGSQTPPTNNPAELVTTLTTDKTSYSPGEKVQATLTVRNPSSIPRTYFHPDCNVGLSLKLSYGPLTATGQTSTWLTDQITCMSMGGTAMVISGNSQTQFTNDLSATVAILSSVTSGAAVLEASADGFTATKNLTIINSGSPTASIPILDRVLIPASASGPVGTRVEILGNGIAGGNTVQIGGQEIITTDAGFEIHNPAHKVIAFIVPSSLPVGSYTLKVRTASGILSNELTFIVTGSTSGGTQTSTILVRRVQQDESTTQTNTSSRVDQGTPTGDTNGLATFTGVPVGTRMVSATDLSGQTETAGYCQFNAGSAGCSVSTFNSSLSCNGSECTVSVPVSAGLNTRVAFKYTPSATGAGGSSGTNTSTNPDNQTIINTFGQVVAASNSVQQTYNQALLNFGSNYANPGMQAYRNVLHQAQTVFNSWEAVYLTVPLDARGAANSNGKFDYGLYQTVKKIFEYIKQQEQAAGVSSSGGSSPPVTTTTGATTGGTTGAPSAVSSSGSLDLTNVQFFPKNQIAWGLDYDYRIKSGGGAGEKDPYINPDVQNIGASGGPGSASDTAAERQAIQTGLGAISAGLTYGPTLLAGGLPTLEALSGSVVGAVVALLIKVAIGGKSVGPNYVAVLGTSGGQLKVTAAGADNGANENAGRILGQTVINIVQEVAKQKGKSLQDAYVGRIGDYKNLFFINTNLPESESTNQWYAYPEAAATTLAKTALEKAAGIQLTPTEVASIYGKLALEMNDYRLNVFKPEFDDAMARTAYDQNNRQ